MLRQDPNSCPLISLTFIFAVEIDLARNSKHCSVPADNHLGVLINPAISKHYTAAPIFWNRELTGARNAESVSDDYLEGVAAIAEFLGWEGKSGERRVYNARGKAASCPIRKRKGMGIYAFKSELIEWLKADCTLPRAATA